MGCDIHLYTEAKKSVNNVMMWVNIDNWKPNPYHNDEDEKEFQINPMYRSRNYTLFSLLAGVRDYSEKTKMVSEAKGLPEDISNHTKIESERWGSDGHTHSFLTLAELKKFQETEPNKVYSGLITVKEAKNLELNGITPESWCQGSSDETLVRREWVEKDNSLVPIIRELEKRMKDEFWIHGNEYDKELEEKVRIVFWFDN